MDDTFKPTEKAREVFKAMNRDAGDTIMEKFFALWEAEEDARKAGSIAAHAYIRNGARVAVFGAHCAGHEPRLDMWLAACEEAFREAIKDVCEAVIKAEVGDTPEEALALTKGN